jgi:hypothetical protein
MLTAIVVIVAAIVVFWMVCAVIVRLTFWLAGWPS